MIKIKSIKEKLIPSKKKKKIVKKDKKTDNSSKKNSVLSAKSKDIEKKIPSLEEMLKAGVHFGHRTSKWNSRMKEYIYTTRNNVHIIDLEQVYNKLKKALIFLQDIKKTAVKDQLRGFLIIFGLFVNIFSSRS